jgi:photosystem II stability/assembly factor-like uncharacterized protein
VRKYQWRDGARDLGIMAILALSGFVWTDRAQAQTGEHRWAGIVFDAFAHATDQGVEAWTVEDGGRIRYRNPVSGQWSFQTVPDQVRDTLHRVHFLTNGTQPCQVGWAVGQGGWVIKTTTGGAAWNQIGSRIPSALFSSLDPYEELYDIHFINANDGWLVGKHRFMRTFDGGLNWADVLVLDANIPPQVLSLFADYHELYALDVVERTDGSRLGLAVMQPGYVLRSYASGPSDPNYDLLTWQLVWDVHVQACGGMGVAECQAASGILQGCECDACAPLSHGGPWYEPWDVEISRNASPGMKLALFSGGIVFQCGLVFSSTDDGQTWTKELHECTCMGAGCINCNDAGHYALYNDDPNDPSDLNRHQSFKTLYGLGIQEGDNSAIAAGYNGQLLVRNPQYGVWEDRSIFSPTVPTTPNGVKYPMNGVDALAGTWGVSGSFGVVTGMGGHILETNDGGNNYDLTKAVGEPHRTKSVFFKDVGLGGQGWQGGQFFRLGQTTDAGVHWNEQDPEANPLYQNCRAIAFEPTGQHGVAVGDWYTDPQTDTPRPKIRYTTDGAVNPWQEDVTILAGVAYLENDLFEATWAPNDVFWAAGTGGLILNSANGGQTWRQYLPSLSDFNQFTIEGLAFVNGSNGVFVGNWPTGGAAYHYQVGPPASWTTISLPSLPPGEVITGLYNVEWDLGGSAAWAVGEKSVNDIREGIVLRSIWGGTSFGAFEQVNPGGFPRCVTGGELDESSVLTEAEIAPLTGDLWVGGMCGRVWVRRATTGNWFETKSQTSAHVTDISFRLEGSQPVGYVNGYRSGPLQQCIVRVQN